MEPITYANGSTLEDPAITYGIVFSNFMTKGVYTYQGGTDQLIELMEAEMLAQSASICESTATPRKSASENGRVRGVRVNGRTIKMPRGRHQLQFAGHDFQLDRRGAI